MNKLMLALTLTTVVGASALLSHADTIPDMPGGVAYKDWIPLTDKMGFVIVHYQSDSKSTPMAIPDKHVTLMAGPTPGYFVVRGPTGWVRVAVIEPVSS